MNLNSFKVVTWLMMIVWGAVPALFWVVFMLLSYTVYEDTVWSSDYSEVMFDNVSYGEKDTEVLNYLGIPLNKWIVPRSLSQAQAKEVAWAYSAQGAPRSNYYVRIVFFCEHKVVRKVKDFYFD